LTLNKEKDKREKEKSEGEEKREGVKIRTTIVYDRLCFKALPRAATSSVPLCRLAYYRCHNEHYEYDGNAVHYYYHGY
jgi:hypothetical protein